MATNVANCGRSAVKIAANQPSQRLFVDPVAMVDEGAGKLSNRQHPLVVFEDPAELAVRRSELGDGVAAREFDHHEGELAGEP